MIALRPLLPILLLLVTAFAGCVGSEGSGEEATPSGPAEAGPAEFDDATGAIEGIVHDDNLAPIEGAQVALLDTEVPPTTSAPDGRFTFSRLAPGEYRLVAQKLGYETAAKNIAVEPGGATQADLTLVALGVVEPYSEILQGKGLFGCGASWRPAVAVSGVAACGVAEGTQFDDFLLQFELTGKPTEWMGTVYEMEWRSTQTLGKGLSVNFEVDGCSNYPASTFQRIRGYSPLRAWHGPETVKEKMENNTKSPCDDKVNCTEEKCRMHSRVFSSPDTLGANSPADVGVTFQQQFEQYISVFYNEPAPEQHTAIADT